MSGHAHYTGRVVFHSVPEMCRACLALILTFLPRPPTFDRHRQAGHQRGKMEPRKAASAMPPVSSSTSSSSMKDDKENKLPLAAAKQVCVCV